MERDELFQSDLDGDYEESVTLKISRLANKLNAHSTHLLHEHSNLKLVEWRILRCLDALGHKPSVMHLAEAMQIDKGQLSRSVKAMSAEGLLSVTEDEEDHRTHYVEMTETGRTAVETVAEFAERRHAFLIQGIDKNDLQTFLRVLETITSRADVDDF